MVVLHPLSTSNHNPLCNVCSSLLVVLHPLSTSNHNGGSSSCRQGALYCILFLHQTTTYYADEKKAWELYCILFLHQTTTVDNHRYVDIVLYCILFLHQTTTQSAQNSSDGQLYCILFLHQTTTRRLRSGPPIGCIASSFYIKPQHTDGPERASCSCIASSFYIKPQPRTPDTLIFGHLTASRHDTKRGGVHRGSRFDAVFTFSTNIRKIIFTEIRRCMSVQRAGARLRSDSSEANI